MSIKDEPKNSLELEVQPEVIPMGSEPAVSPGDSDRASQCAQIRSCRLDRFMKLMVQPVFAAR